MKQKMSRFWCNAEAGIVMVYQIVTSSNDLESNR